MAKSTRHTTTLVARPTSASGTPRRRRSAHPTDADIAARAYALYRARGGHDGSDIDDWLQAERELSDTARSTAA
jgi:hypothetical protein